VNEVKGFANVVFPARDLSAGVAAWTAMLGREPAFVGDDFAVFSGEGVEVGLTALPWVDHPLVFWKVDDVEDTHRVLVARGATPLGEIADGSLAELDAAEVVNGDRHRRRPRRPARGRQSPGREPDRAHAGSGLAPPTAGVSAGWGGRANAQPPTSPATQVLSATSLKSVPVGSAAAASRPYGVSSAGRTIFPPSRTICSSAAAVSSTPK
jgi:hypothetical protein